MLSTCADKICVLVCEFYFSLLFQEKAEKSWFDRNANSVELVTENYDSEEDQVNKYKQMKASSKQLKRLQQVWRAYIYCQYFFSFFNLFNSSQMFHTAGAQHADLTSFTIKNIFTSIFSWGINLAMIFFHFGTCYLFTTFSCLLAQSRCQSLL